MQQSVSVEMRMRGLVDGGAGADTVGILGSGRGPRGRVRGEDSELVNLPVLVGTTATVAKAILFPSSISSRALEQDVCVLVHSASENIEAASSSWSWSSDWSEHTETMLDMEDARERPRDALREAGRERECTRFHGYG